jgi:nucleotide-binding universal stress UspA family protein
MKIICGTDFSSNSSRAATVAATIAKRMDVPLELVHVMDETGYYSELGIPDDALPDARAALAREVERLRPLAPSVGDKIVHGPADERLSELAQSEGAGLVVVSSLSRRPATRWLIGSVSGRLAESCPAPVLILRDDAPFIEWLEGRRTLKVMICFDGSVSSQHALGYAKDLAALGPCELVVARVDWPVSEGIRFGTGESLLLTGNSPKVQAIIERETMEAVQACIGSLNARIRVEGGLGRVDEHLIQIAASEKADVILVGTHHRHGIERLWKGSISRGVVMRSPASVIVVPSATKGVPVVPSYKRVLVATDAEAGSHHTIANACALLPKGGAIHVLHVMAPYSPTAHDNPASGSKGDYVAEISKRTDAIARLIPKDAVARGIDVSSEIVESEDTVIAITQAAERMGADVICVGAHRSSRLAAGLLGSVAQGVVLRSPRPVLLVKTPEE